LFATKNKPKKYPSEEELNTAQEPVSAYESKPEIETDDSDPAWDNLPERLKQLLEIELKQSELGLDKPHAQVMAEIKKKIYNFS
jgi:hypothetical protein